MCPHFRTTTSAPLAYRPVRAAYKYFPMSGSISSTVSVRQLRGRRATRAPPRFLLASRLVSAGMSPLIPLGSHPFEAPKNNKPPENSEYTVNQTTVTQKHKINIHPLARQLTVTRLSSNCPGVSPVPPLQLHRNVEGNSTAAVTRWHFYTPQSYISSPPSPERRGHVSTHLFLRTFSYSDLQTCGHSDEHFCFHPFDRPFIHPCVHSYIFFAHTCIQ